MAQARRDRLDAQCRAEATGSVGRGHSERPQTREGSPADPGGVLEHVGWGGASQVYFRKN